MLERANRPATIYDADEDGGEAAPRRTATHEHSEVDNELQAAIEYKIALAGFVGADKVIELLNLALRRRAR